MMPEIPGPSQREYKYKAQGLRQGKEKGVKRSIVGVAIRQLNSATPN